MKIQYTNVPGVRGPDSPSKNHLIYTFSCLTSKYGGDMMSLTSHYTVKTGLKPPKTLLLSRCS